MEGKQLGTIFFFILYFIATVPKWLLSSGWRGLHDWAPVPASESTVLGSQEGFLQLQLWAHVVLRSALYWYQHKKHVSSA